MEQAPPGPSGQGQAHNSPAQCSSLGLRLRGAPVICHVFLKKTATSDAERAASHAVFVSGLPVGLGEQHIKAVFEVFGTVTSVVLHQNKRSGAVSFADASGAQTALELAGSGQVVEYELPLPEGPFGLKAWVQEHKARFPGNSVLQKQLDDWVAAHEEGEEARKRARDAAMADDGWTVVVRAKGRKRGREVGGVATASGGVAMAAAQAAAQAAAAAKERKPSDGFYRFQKREVRRNELLELRQKFEAHRKRISELRAARQFKPC